uniref:Mitochondrial import inner membrane translocase subunit TIM9 n=1 Tax=Nothobranchius furzeri TaxID=105023 RepID=A0A8C6KTH8_NOTFU
MGCPATCGQGLTTHSHHLQNRCGPASVQLLDRRAFTPSSHHVKSAPTRAPNTFNDVLVKIKCTIIPCELIFLSIIKQKLAMFVCLLDFQFKEFLGTYNKVTENCFMDCVKDFTSRDVKPEESSCSESCLQKYLKMTQRISMRFQEYHIQQNEALAAKAGLLGQPR